MDNLILTGWFWKDYAIAAAVALRHYKKADIKAVSTHRLPEFLNEVGTKYKEIAILGVGLANNIELLDKALTKLQKNKVKVRWISSMDFPNCVDEQIREKLDSFICCDDGITEAVSQCFNVPYGDIAPLIRNEVSKDIHIYHELIDAASYSYRNYQNETDYCWVVKMISRRETETSLLKSDWATKLLQHYRRYGHRELVGKSQVIMDLQSRITRIASRDKARVFIYGESGTGKETIAILIHNKSPRKDEPFCSFNCASVTPNLLEDRFFGHEKGAFTGANEQRPGLFEQADGGTLFLDEIGELPLEAQGILLRVLEGGRFTRMGGKDEIEVDVRLLCATNRDLAAMVRDGQFREDLFHRLNVVQIVVPLLRKHKDDIRDIANGYFLKRKQHRLEPEQIEALMSYDYPGNVRELINLLERSCVLGITDFAGMIRDHKETTASLAAKPEEDIPDDLDSAIRTHVRRVYEKYNNNLSRAAIALNAARNTVKKYLD